VINETAAGIEDRFLELMETDKTPPLKGVRGM
jgi:hypothetical protein